MLQIHYGNDSVSYIQSKSKKKKAIWISIDEMTDVTANVVLPPTSWSEFVLQRRFRQLWKNQKEMNHATITRSFSELIKLLETSKSNTYYLTGSVQGITHR